jgi:hypothetical protein
VLAVGMSTRRCWSRGRPYIAAQMLSHSPSHHVVGSKGGLLYHSSHLSEYTHTQPSVPPASMPHTLVSGTEEVDPLEALVLIRAVADISLCQFVASH